jgi:hypothetical protein
MFFVGDKAFQCSYINLDIVRTSDDCHTRNISWHCAVVIRHLLQFLGIIKFILLEGNIFLCEISEVLLPA